MKKTVLAIAFATLLTSASQAATVEFSMAQSLISPEAAAAGAPEGGTVYDFFVTTDADILSIGQVLIDLTAGSMFNVDPPFGSNTTPPDPAFIALNRALEADSWITTPGPTSLLGPDLTATDGSSTFGDLVDSGPQTDFHFARLGLTPDALGIFSGRVTLAGPTGPENFPFSLDMGSISSTIIPTPAPGPLDFGLIVCLGIGVIEDAITFTGGNPTGTELSNQSISNLFFANIDGASVDLGIDIALAQTFPLPVVATADLSISGPGGPFDYQLSAFCPEPTSLALVSLGLCGLGIRTRNP